MYTHPLESKHRCSHCIAKICLINDYISWQRLTFVDKWQKLIMFVSVWYYLFITNRSEHRYSIKLIPDQLFSLLDVFIITLFLSLTKSLPSLFLISQNCYQVSSVLEECTFLSSGIDEDKVLSENIYYWAGGHWLGITIANTIYYNCYL